MLRQSESHPPNKRQRTSNSQSNAQSPDPASSSNGHPAIDPFVDNQPSNPPHHGGPSNKALLGLYQTPLNRFTSSISANPPCLSGAPTFTKQSYINGAPSALEDQIQSLLATNLCLPSQVSNGFPMTNQILNPAPKQAFSDQKALAYGSNLSYRNQSIHDNIKTIEVPVVPASDIISQLPCQSQLTGGAKPQYSSLTSWKQPINNIAGANRPPANQVSNPTLHHLPSQSQLAKDSKQPCSKQLSQSQPINGIPTSNKLQANHVPNAPPQQPPSQNYLTKSNPTPSNSDPHDPQLNTLNNLPQQQQHTRPPQLIIVSAMRFYTRALELLTQEGPRKYHAWPDRNVAYDIAATLILSGVYLDQRSNVDESAAWIEWSFGIKGIWKKKPFAMIPFAVPLGMVEKFKEKYGDGNVVPGLEGLVKGDGSGKVAKSVKGVQSAC